MIIIGLDPGIARTGFGIIDTNKTNYFVKCGCLTTQPNQDQNDRLYEVANDLVTLIENYNVTAASIEQVYFGTNTSTAIQTAQVRGALIYVLRKHHIQINSLTPLEIKSRLTGYGRATKQQIQAIVMQRLDLTTPPQPDDAADALAAALCIVDNHSNISTIAKYNNKI